MDPDETALVKMGEHSPFDKNLGEVEGLEFPSVGF